METDPLIQTVDTGYMEDLIRSCQKYCKGTEHAVYELLCSVTESAWKQGHLKQELVLPPVRKKRPEPMISLYTREQTRLFLEAVYQAPCPHRLEFFLADDKRIFYAVRGNDRFDRAFIDSLHALFAQHNVP